MRNKEDAKSILMNLVVLKMISTGDCYAYELSDMIQEATEGIINIANGTVYPVLYRMEEDGYISSYKIKVGKRLERVYYHLEPKGKEELEKLVDAVKSILLYEREDRNLIIDKTAN